MTPDEAKTLRSTEEWYTPEINQETYKRIRVSLAALAYEEYDDPIMSDAEFDKLARSIDLTVDTRREDLDKWFRENFKPNTGSWVHLHPDLQKLRYILENLFYKEKE